MYSETIDPDQQKEGSVLSKVVIGVVLVIILGFAAAAVRDGRIGIAVSLLSIPVLMWGGGVVIDKLTGHGTGLVYEVREDGVYYRRGHQDSFKHVAFESIAEVQVSTDDPPSDLSESPSESMERIRNSNRRIKLSPKKYGFEKGGIRYDVAGGVRIYRPDERDLQFVSDRPKEFAETIQNEINTTERN